MLSAENRSFFHLKYSFLRPVCRPVDSASLGGCNTCPHPHSYATRCIGSLFSAWVRGPPLHFRAQRCSYKKCTVRYRGSSEPQQVPGVACLLSPASCPYFTAAFFWVLLRLPKSFNGTLYMTSPHPLFVLFSVFSFRRKLRPHIQLGFYALQTR